MATHRRAWLDPRFVIGAALVVASIVGVWLVVQAAGRSTEVWTATEPLLPGSTVAEGDVELTSMQLANVDQVYLTAGESPVGMLVTSTIGEGEALPLSALGDEASVDLAPLVIDVAGGVPSSVEPGSVVDIWSAAPAEQGAFEAPTVLVDGAIVVGIQEDEGLIADRSSVRIEVLVERTGTAALLDAIANEHSLSLVPMAVQDVP